MQSIEKVTSHCVNYDLYLAQIIIKTPKKLDISIPVSIIFFSNFRIDGIDRQVRTEREGLDVSSRKETTGTHRSGHERRFGNFKTFILTSFHIIFFLFGFIFLM